MKIAISGAHGVGKTTLVNALAGTIKIPVIHEVVRAVAKEMEIENCGIIKVSDTETIERFQTKVFYHQVLREIELPDFISDRSLFDIVAYMEYYGLPTDMIDEFFQYVIRCSTNYDAIIYCPIPKWVEIEADGFRLVEGQDEYDAILKRLLFESECQVIKLTRNRSRWIDQVLAAPIMKKYLKRGNQEYE